MAVKELTRDEIVERLENQWFGSALAKRIERPDPELREQLSQLISLIRSALRPLSENSASGDVTTGTQDQIVKHPWNI